MTINTKFNVGDFVYFIRNNQVITSKAGSISVLTGGHSSTTEIKYHIIFNLGLSTYTESIKESELFATKQELLNSL
jgi:hypothetical protein